MSLSNAYFKSPGLPSWFEDCQVTISNRRVTDLHAWWAWQGPRGDRRRYADQDRLTPPDQADPTASSSSSAARRRCKRPRLFEVKYDSFRALEDLERGTVRLISQGERVQFLPGALPVARCV